MASGRKLVRDVFFSKQPLFSRLLSSQTEAYNRRLCLIGSNRCLSKRCYSVLNDFSKTIKAEASSNKEFQQSMKQLQEKAEKLKGTKDEFKVRMQQVTDQLYKHVDGMWTRAGAIANEVSAAVADKFSATKAEVKETFGVASKDGGPRSQIKDTTKALFGAFESMISSASPKVSLASQKLKEAKVFDLAKKGYELVKDDLSGKSNRRKRLEYAASTPFTGETSARTEIVIVPSVQPVWEKKWEAFKQKMQGHRLFKGIEKMSKPVVTRTQEYAEDLQEMWETSDNPVIEKIQDLNDRVFRENDAAMSFKEIKQRDPLFSLPEFVAEVEEVIYPVLNAYIKGDFEVLKKYCSREIVERCRAEHRAYESHGIIFDNKILHVSEVDVRETKMMRETPIIILNFQTQQVHCLRDRHGSVAEGSKDTIQTVHYAWAMQQIEPEVAGKDGIYTMWKLKDMQQFGVAALI